VGRPARLVLWKFWPICVTAFWSILLRQSRHESFIKQVIKVTVVFTASMAPYKPNKVKSTRGMEISRGMLTVYFSEFHRHYMELPGLVLETWHTHSPRSGLSTTFVSTTSR
jgi:hypothetical protein